MCVFNPIIGPLPLWSGCEDLSGVEPVRYGDLPNPLINSVNTPGSLSMRHQFPASLILSFGDELYPSFLVEKLGNPRRGVRSENYLGTLGNGNEIAGKLV